jgi:hypothetical protein
MSLRQWLWAPYRLYRIVKDRWDVHTLYLPFQTVARLKAAVQGEGTALLMGVVGQGCLLISLLCCNV